MQYQFNQVKRYLTCLILFLLTQTQLNAQFLQGSFEFEDRVRNYDVYLPQNYQPGIRLPVVLNLHGYSWSTAEHAAYSLMQEYADTSGFIVVYPEGSYYNQVSGWNNGLRCVGFGQVDTTSNDVGFISALIDTLKSDYDIDLTRVYSCGFSQGGEMTYRLFIELGHRFAAVASVAGKLNSVSGTIGAPLRPVPVLHFHGTLDDIEYYGPGLANLWSVEATLNFWIQNNNCVLTPDTIAIADTCISDSCTVQKISYTDCADSTRIIFYKILKGGHNWPGADTSVWSGGGFLNRDINASQNILNFFKNYDNPLVNIAWTKNAEIIPAGYFPAQDDTLFIKACVVNPQDHPVEVIAKILGTAYTDSVILYDDGMHGDENPNDNIFGNSKFLSGIPEDHYFVDIYTHDLFEGASQKFRLLNYYFLTKGPVVLDHYKITSSDTIPHDGDRLKFESYLKNEGTTATIKNVCSQIIALDTLSVIKPLVTTYYGNIQANSTVKGDAKQFIKFNLGTEDSVWVKFGVNIYSKDVHIWSDTFFVFVHKDPDDIRTNNSALPNTFVLQQNYPNPFNPSTTIEFQIPSVPSQSGNSEFVTLKIYNIIGQKVATLVSQKLNAGKYNYSWDASGFASGVYYYRLEAGTPSASSGTKYVQTRKMVLLR